MLGISDYWAFVATVLVFLMLPGPGTFAILTSATRGGLRGGYAALVGLMLGDWLLMLAAFVGVAALLASHPILFKSVQWLGVAYLVWVGIQLIRTSGDLSAAILPVGPGKYFRQVFFVTLINPKAIVFYMAFFPLFIDRARYLGVATLGAMGLTISALTFAYCTVLIVGGNWLARRLRENKSVGRWLSRFAGVALIAFGARLATE